MANAVFPKWKEAIMTGAANSDLDQTGTDGVFAALVSNAYSYNSAHEFVSSVSSNFIGTDQEIPATKAYTNGNFTTTGTNTWTAVAGGSTVGSVVLYRKNSGANSTWRLVCFLDSASIAALPVSTNGGDISINWDDTKLFQL
jgi:hypothetical protein